MAKKLFVGNLPWSIDDEGLMEAFAPFGKVTEAKVITDRETGRSRGFGFVSYNTPAEMEAAIKGMNNSTLDGRTINVNEAQDKPRPGGGGGYERRDDRRR